MAHRTTGTRVPDEGDERGSHATVGSSSVTQDYLKVVYAAEEWGNEGISITDLAARMGVVASTASETVRRLTDQGLVTHEPYQKVHLSPEGRAAAVAMVRRHRLLETYLHERLDFDWDEVHREAEILEHAVSDTLLEHLDRSLGYPLRDPHGDPIPAADGTWFAPPMHAVDALGEGGSATVVRISDSSSDMLHHLETCGVVLDATLQVVRRSGAIGTTRVRVTPPASWTPRAETPAATPGEDGEPPSYEVDLGTVATAAVFVADGTVAEPTQSARHTPDRQAPPRPPSAERD
ncbi:metal-dependent transcriptional regulator [Actinomyces sp.]|uniref:metal-dependent transcriptional regulator n=1 Tax=Actinomyces sp. TaxID=29317 RepID=UPI00289B988F|nr:metal-dependent transcriptional regulator [Actinomyces sp.]